QNDRSRADQIILFDTVPGRKSSVLAGYTQRRGRHEQITREYHRDYQTLPHTIHAELGLAIDVF
ncbi:MAG: hypothetical protein ACJAU3_001186, partial [Zhongshania sp.]